MVLIWLLWYNTFHSSTESSILWLWHDISVWICGYKVFFCDQKNINTEETEVLGSTRELQDPLSRRGPGQRKRKLPRWMIIFGFHIIILQIEKQSPYLESLDDLNKHHLAIIWTVKCWFAWILYPIHLWTLQILPRNLFCRKKSTFLAIFLALIYCTWICFEYFLLNVICRVDDYIYDGNKDDLDASNDADFSLKPCSKSKKKSSKKVQI